MSSKLEAFKFFRGMCGCVGRQAIAAMNLLRAEQSMRDRGWSVRWEPEDEPYELGDAETRMPDEVYCAVLVDERGEVLDSLGMIGDPSREYMRIVEAELASGALSEEQDAIDREERSRRDCERIMAL